MRIGKGMDGLTLLEVLGGGVDKLQGNQLEAAFLEAVNDVSDKSALDAIGLFIYNVTNQPTNTASSFSQCTSKKNKNGRWGRSRVVGRTLTMMYVRSWLGDMTDSF
jgi:hypothetical protein